MTADLFAGTAMLIRKPVAEVFNAFVDPAITTQFWFTKSTGKLEAGKKLTWTWEMYNVSVDVQVISILPGKEIIVEWGNNGQVSIVKWIFTSPGDDTTFVEIVNDGFSGNTAQIVAQVRDSTGGFTWVLAGLKAYLEHGIRLNLIADRFPKGK